MKLFTELAGQTHFGKRDEINHTSFGKSNHTTQKNNNTVSKVGHFIAKKSNHLEKAVREERRENIPAFV